MALKQSLQLEEWKENGGRKTMEKDHLQYFNIFIVDLLKQNGLGFIMLSPFLGKSM